jgi:hypothetical protein
VLREFEKVGEVAERHAGVVQVVPRNLVAQLFAELWVHSPIWRGNCAG